jgi:hypothetical protein
MGLIAGRSTFDLISAPLVVKMSQKQSLPQSPQTVQLVLTGNINRNISFTKVQVSGILAFLKQQYLWFFHRQARGRSK